MGQFDAILEESARSDRPGPEPLRGLVMKRLFIILGIVMVVGVVGSMFLPPRRFAKASISRCYENLQSLEQAKRSWAKGNHKAPTDTPTWKDLEEYLLPYTNRPGWTNGMPVCPTGGTYKLGRVGELPTCSIGGPGHSLSESDGFKTDR